MVRLIVCFTLLASAALAQVAVLTGRITDPSGAVVPDAGVTAKSADTGISTSTQTNSEGYYTLPALQPGRYEVTVLKTGFVPVRQTGLELIVQQVARLDVALTVGAVTGAIEVQAATPLLDTDSSTVGQVIGNRQVSELPLLGRNTYALAMLVPGVRPSGGVNNLVIDVISTSFYSINGQRANSNEFLLDGAPNSAAGNNQPVVNANPDMVQEFKVETNNFAAEYGRAAGGVFNVVTRSGTNQLHLSAYEFFRNEKLSANDFFANRSGVGRAPLRFNQFGGSLGGPAVIPSVYDGRNRTFFFVNTELFRYVEGVTLTGVLPDRRQLTGDFSNARLTDGRLVNIYDPATTASNPSGAGFVRSPFPGNVIPGNRIEPVARNVSGLLPAPAVPNTPLGVTNYTRTDGNHVPKNSYSLRGDHNVTDANRMFARFSYDKTSFLRAPAYGRGTESTTPTSGPQDFTRWNAVFEDTHTFSPTLIATFRYSATRLINHARPYSDGFDVTTIGLPAYMRAGMVNPIALPAITVAGYSVTSAPSNIIGGGLIGAAGIIESFATQQSVQGNFTKNLSKHTFKFGGEFRAIQYNNQQTTGQTNFNFTASWTQGPNPSQSSAIAGLGLATFLLGIPAGSVNPPPALAQTIKYQALFLQDSWKVTPQLTINWGFRYDYESPRTDRFNQLTNFDFRAPSPLQAPGLSPVGGLTFVGVNGLSRHNATPDRNNFAPRLGVAYRLAQRTVLRAGGGLFYAGTTGIGSASVVGTSGFQASTDILTSLDGINPIVKWSDPYPNGFNRPTGSSLGLSTLLGQSIEFYDRGNYTPYSSQWNFNIQQTAPGNLVFELGYAGSRGVGFAQTRTWNQLPPEALSLGDALRQQVANPFVGKIAVGALAAPTVARAQLLRPFPHFADVSSQNATWSSSSYHALEAKAEKRYASGLSVLFSYTWSKLLDYNSGPFAGETVGASTFQNGYNLAAEWSPSTLDQTHRLILSTVYELPFYRKRAGLAAKFLGGWQIGGIAMRFSGGPLGATSAVNNTFSQGGGQRPNWNGQNACVSDPTPDRWLNGGVFSVPAPYSFGSAPRTFNGCRSDGTSQIDLSVTKNTRFFERWNLQFRAESFNLSNTPRFAPPNQAFGNPQYGIVNARGNLPRVVQFGLKLIY